MMKTGGRIYIFGGTRAQCQAKLACSRQLRPAGDIMIRFVVKHQSGQGPSASTLRATDFV